MTQGGHRNVNVFKHFNLYGLQLVSNSNTEMLHLFRCSSPLEKNRKEGKKKLTFAIKHRKASIGRHLFNVVIGSIEPNRVFFFFPFLSSFLTLLKSNCSRVIGPWMWGGRKDCTSWTFNTCDYISILLPRSLREGASISVAPTDFFFSPLAILNHLNHQAKWTEVEHKQIDSKLTHRHINTNHSSQS